MSDLQKERLANYVEAERKALAGQEVQTGTVKVRRADLKNIARGIDAMVAAGITTDDTSGAPNGARGRRIVLSDE